jgi:adenylosuccinate lyase
VFVIDRYARPEMKSLWTEEAKYQAWALVEKAHLAALVDRGEAPKEVLSSFEKALTLKTNQDYLEREEETGHDVIAFITEVASAMGDHGRFLHMGLTSSDVLDTSLSVRCLKSIDLLLESLAKVRGAFAFQAFSHSQTLCIGRTHGIHAEPMSFGQVLCSYFAEFQRCHKDLLALKKHLCFGKLSGAVGVYSQLGPDMERAVLGKLGLKPEPVATQVLPRDRFTRMGQTLENLAMAVERFAVNLRHWARTELGEVLEPFGSKQKGSSAMPHKKNPVLSENLTGLAHVVKGLAHTLSQNSVLWHERDISHSSVERMALPDLFVTTHFMLHRTAGLVEKMQVRPEAMKVNLNRTGGLWASGTVLTGLVEAGMGRKEAYEIIQEVALPLSEKVALGNMGAQDFKNGLKQKEQVSRLITDKQLNEIFDPSRYLKHQSLVFQRVFGLTPERLHGDLATQLKMIPALQKQYEVRVSLLPDVLDVEGKAIAQDMKQQGIESLELRVHRVFVIKSKEPLSFENLYQYAKNTLHNAVMETFEVEEVL